MLIDGLRDIFLFEGLSDEQLRELAVAGEQVRFGPSGTLRISTRASAGHVVIEIADTGPGMPAEVQARAFEAFYTTKDVGKGAGLGLDISRRIVVERHHGEITIDSRPGETTLRVQLPCRRADHQ
jgi:signal transduction histidine kinase